MQVDHVTVYRWVQRFTPPFIDATRPCRHAASDRWFVDETDVKVADRWVYLYRAIDQFGQVIDVLVAEKRDLAGREWRPRGEPTQVNVYDFVEEHLGMATPYGSMTSPRTVTDRPLRTSRAQATTERLHHSYHV